MARKVLDVVTSHLSACGINAESEADTAKVTAWIGRRGVTIHAKDAEGRDLKITLMVEAVL